MYEKLVDRFKRYSPKKELLQDKKVRLAIEKNLGLEAEKGLKSDFYVKVIGLKLNEEREKAVLQISQPNLDSSMGRLSAKLELIEVIRKDISSVIERGRRVDEELERISKDEDV